MSDFIHQALKRDGECPDLSQLFEAMQQDAADARRLQAEQHLGACPGCQTEWALFRQFEAGEVRPEERAAVDFIAQKVQAGRIAQRRVDNVSNRPTFWQRLWTPAWMGGAALAMAALVMTIGITSQWRARHASTVDSGDNQTLRSSSVEITTSLASLTESPQRIEWKPVAGAVTYTVVLTEVDGAQVFYKKVTSLSLPLPDDVRTLVRKGKLLMLTVTALDSAHREIASSGTVKIAVHADGLGPK